MFYVSSTSTICSCFSVIRICLIKQSFVIAMGHTKLDIAEKACILSPANKRLINADISLHIGCSIQAIGKQIK